MKPRIKWNGTCWVCRHPMGWTGTSKFMRLSYTACLLKWYDYGRSYGKW